MELILLLIVGSFFIWLLYKNVKANPESMSKGNLSKSFRSMGLLAIGLILFVWVLVLLLRA